MLVVGLRGGCAHKACRPAHGPHSLGLLLPPPRDHPDQARFAHPHTHLHRLYASPPTLLEVVLPHPYSPYSAVAEGSSSDQTLISFFDMLRATWYLLSGEEGVTVGLFVELLAWAKIDRAAVRAHWVEFLLTVLEAGSNITAPFVPYAHGHRHAHVHSHAHTQVRWVATSAHWRLARRRSPI